MGIQKYLLIAALAVVFAGWTRPVIAQVPVDNQIDLENAEKAANSFVTGSMSMLDSLDAVHGAVAKLAKVKAPTADAIDTLSAISVDLAKSQTVDKWLVSNKTDFEGLKPKIVVKPEDPVLVATYVLPEANLQLKAVRTSYSKLWAAYGRAKMAVPDSITSSYKTCIQGLVDAIDRLTQATDDLSVQARDDGNSLAHKFAALKDKARAALADVPDKASGPSALGKSITDISPTLQFAARCGEIDAVSLPKLRVKSSTTDDVMQAAADCLDHLSAASTSISGHLTDTLQNATDERTKLMQDPAHEALSAHAMADLLKADLKDEQGCQKVIATLSDGLQVKPLVVLTAKSKDPLAKIAAAAKSLSQDAARLNLIVGDLTSTADDLAYWTQDEVNLYYFEDVDRLLHMLTENVKTLRGDTNFQATYEQSAKELAKATEDLGTTQAELNDAKRKLAQAKEDLRVQTLKTATAKAASSADWAAAAAKVKKANDDVILAQKAVDDAKAAELQAKAESDHWSTLFKAAPTDADLKKKAEDSFQADVAAQHQVDLRNADLTEASSNLTQAKADQAALNSDIADMQKQVDALQVTVDSLTEKETAGTKAYRDASSAAFMDAYVATHAFATAQANSPYFVTDRDKFLKAREKTTDPVERVYLYGEPTEKRIVIRGHARDIVVVKKLIELIDRPQGQSEISVYSAQISSPTDQKTILKVQNSLRTLDRELSLFSMYNEAAQRVLRNTIAAVVKQRVDEWKSGDGRIEGLDPLDAKAALRKTKSKQYPNLGWAYACLDPTILRQMHLDDALTSNQAEYFLADLPSIAAPESLGQATAVLSLLRPGLRNRIVSIVKGRTQKEIGQINDNFTKEFSDQTQKDKFGSSHPNDLRIDSFLDIFLGLDYAGRPSRPTEAQSQEVIQRQSVRIGTSLTPTVADSEVDHDSAMTSDPDVLILQDGYLFGVIRNRLEGLKADIKRGEGQLAAAIITMKSNTGTPSSNERQAIKVSEYNFAQQTELLKRQELYLRAKMTVSILGLSASDIDALLPSKFDNDNRQTALAMGKDPEPWLVEKWITDLKDVVHRITDPVILDNGELAGGLDDHARVARYNGALRRVMGRFYSDMTDHLENGPKGLLANVEGILANSGGQVSDWTSETLIASNRLAARVDPSASATAQDSKSIDILGESLMLANLLTAAKSEAIPGILQSAKDITNQQKKEYPAVYGLGTGAPFEVTPVVDPTGQAIRFRFNYDATVRVREPDGTTSPQLNHIERHSVNTEVVLDNLAIKRISTFQSNAQLGLPASKDGGLPIFRDLPFFKEIPLIGWFTYRIGGRRPVVQRSVILSQAAIYPTFDDVVGSLTNSSR